MNCKICNKYVKRLALGLAALALAATPSFAVELAAVPAQWTPPPPGGGAPIAMWGFIEVTDAANFDCATEIPSDPWAVGPTLTATDGGSLTVNIKNCLADPVSIFIPGQLKATVPVTFQDTAVPPRTRVRSFDAETAEWAPPAVGGFWSYTWADLKEGTYLYHSGTHPQVQVQMGLYGALVVTGGLDYPVVAQEEVLVYSEIDPALHDAVAAGCYGSGTPDPTCNGEEKPAWMTSTFDYMPRYFLINGASYPYTADIVMTTGDVLLRFVNAGLKTHVPTLEGGLYMSLIAEDGNLYPFPIEQYGVELQAAKTIDAVVNVGTAGTYALYDRALGLTNWLDTGGGMLTYLQAGAAGCTVDANCDDGLYCNGTETCADDVCQAGTPPVCADDGLFCNGAAFCNEATGSCDAGTPPTCDDGVGCTDDSCNGGTDSCDNVANDANCPDDALFCNGIEFCDAALDCSSTGDACPAGDICIEDGNICEQAANVPPFANDDFAETQRNTPVSFSVTGNDVDADGFIDVESVMLTNTTTSAGGTVAKNPALDGTVLYTPKRGFRGTDLFTYTVMDNDEATSNVATVRVNVVK